ncbi:MAG: VOC family protein [Actinomycetota bacterium]
MTNPPEPGTSEARFRGLDYVILYVSDLDRSIAFYRDDVGLPFKFSENGYAEFATEPSKFALFDRSLVKGLIGREISAGGPQGEVAFVVPDVDAEADRLRRSGVRILSGPVDRPWGHRTLHVLDPDGFVVEFAQEIPRSVG